MMYCKTSLGKLFEQNSQEASPFKDLETENRQRRAFKEMFGHCQYEKKTPL